MSTDLKMRLSFRREGKWWVAYTAELGTMKGAQPIGRIALAIVEAEPARKQQFMDLMQEAVSDLVQATTGVRPIWPSPPQPAPEHERSGSA